MPYLSNKNKFKSIDGCDLFWCFQLRWKHCNSVEYGEFEDPALVEFHIKISFISEALREEYEKKIQQGEQNWSQQISSTRATLELVKEQLQRESEMQLEDLNKKYLQELGNFFIENSLPYKYIQKPINRQIELWFYNLFITEEQYEKLQQEKEEAVDSLQEKYNLETYELQNRLNEELKAQKSKEEKVMRLPIMNSTILNLYFMTWKWSK